MEILNSETHTPSGTSRLMTHLSTIRPEIEKIDELKQTLISLLNQGGVLSPEAQKVVESIRIELENLGLSKDAISEIV